jgi:ornithine carbamoyltransferase
MTMLDQFETLRTADLLSVDDLAKRDIETLLTTAVRLKRDYRPFHGLMAGRSLVMLFEKPSLRTRMSFEIGFARLGGHPVYFDHQAAGGRIGQREPIEDVAKNLDRF